MPLVLPVHVVCNVSDELIHENIRINSRSRGDWLRLEEAHDGVAILCGSGPSLADCIDEIMELRSEGGRIFALNGAAAFLADCGIMPDYQCILDAREETAQLIGPAREHLFASQVHPECFRRVPTARLWHLQVEGIDDLLPEYERSYCLVGAAASMGNTATCLAYAMGYRELHCYGYDSSHRGDKSHAFHQPMNDGEPCAWVDFGGKTYLCSLTMKLQAEKFQQTARHLKANGCQIFVHGEGLLPDMYNTPEDMTEAQKYEKVWHFDEYRAFSPGEHAVDTFLDVEKERGTLIDIGCGTGRAGLKLSKAGFDVRLVDFASNCRDQEAYDLQFTLADMTKDDLPHADFGFCCDVMEHLPTEDVDDALKHIFSACKRVFLQISTVDDVMGSLIGKPLHLTVKPAAWWARKIEENGGSIVRSFSGVETAVFYVHTQPLEA